MRLKECDLADAANILIAVGDGVLANSLRFSLGLEGFDVRLCDEHSLLRAMAGAEAPGCLVLDHDVFARMLNGDNERRFVGLGFPVILMVEPQDRESDCARTAGRRDPHRRKAAARQRAARHDQIGARRNRYAPPRAALRLSESAELGHFSQATP